MAPPAAGAAAAPDAVTLHGVFIEIFGLGVLLAGKSGIGKSELALELLGRGHRLVADDAAEFQLAHDGRVVGRCPPLLYGFLEVRGLGVLHVGRMFGEPALRASKALDLIVRLDTDSTSDPPDRLHGRRIARSVCGKEIPEIALPVRAGHSLATLVEAACRDQTLKRDGYDAASDFVARQMQQIGKPGS
jgi:serine kinase of HPr protein (carbohydrate metabolism regulator)